MTRSIGMAGSTSAMLSRIDRLNSTFSCSTTPVCRRSQAASTMARSTPFSVGKEIRAQNPENRFKHRNGNEPDDQHIEGAQAAMHQHLVDHHLEKQRRNKRKDLQEK